MLSSCWSSACQTKSPRVCSVSCDCIHSGILCGFLLLSSSRASTTVFISWYQSNFLSGHLLNLAIPGAPRRPDSEGKFKCCKSLEKQGIPPLLHNSTGPDNLQVRRGALLLTSFFPKPRRESTMEITSTRKQRHYIMGSYSSCLEKKAPSQFSSSQ